MAEDILDNPYLTESARARITSNRERMATRERPQDVIRELTPKAGEIIRGGREEAIGYSEEAARQLDPLRQFADLAAFREQQAILGLSGEEAQRRAISQIPINAAQAEAQRRERESFLRRAAATGDISGASLAGSQQLSASQRFGNIQRRLAELEPLARIARGVRSTMATQAEAARMRQAQIYLGTGQQLASIETGAAAPQIRGIREGAQLEGLRGIGKAQTDAAIAAQLARLGGMAAPYLGGADTSQAGYIQSQTGYGGGAGGVLSGEEFRQFEGY